MKDRALLQKSALLCGKGDNFAAGDMHGLVLKGLSVVQQDYETSAADHKQKPTAADVSAQKPCQPKHGSCTEQTTIFSAQAIKPPKEALKVLTILEQAGFEAWLVGGFVRDSLLGVPTHDIDITTNALPEQTSALLKQKGLAVHETGLKHGTITAVLHNQPFEITTYRAEGSYSDKRHPDEVQFIASVEEDLARRDFTINALAFHPKRGLIDPFNGFEDLSNQLIRCVGNPQKRFSEDALRILRALRFASQLGFHLDATTQKALYEQAESLTTVAAERLFKETEKLLCGKAVHDVLVKYVDVLGTYFPELLPMKDLDQKSPYHIYDVLEHTAYVVQYMPAVPLARWAGLFHDMGKPDTFFIDEAGIGHMHGHPQVSVEHLRTVSKRLRFPKKLTQDLALLVRYHDTRPAPRRKEVRKLYLRLHEKEYLFHTMCDLMRADALSQAPLCYPRVEITNEVEELFNAMMAEHVCFSVRDLPISGADLKCIGFSQGPEIGEVLHILYHAVWAGEIPAEADALLQKAEHIYSKRHAR